MPLNLQHSTLGFRVNFARLSLFWVLGLCLIPPLTAQNPHPNRLTPVYVPGAVYHLELVSVSETRPQTKAIPLALPEEEEAVSPTKVITQITQTFDLSAVHKDNETHVEVRQTGLKAIIHADDQVQAEYDSANPAMSPPAIQQLFAAGKERIFTLVYNDLHQFARIIVPNEDDATPLGKHTAYTTRQFAEAFRLMRDGLLPAPPQNGKSKDSWEYSHRVQLPPLGELQLHGKATLTSSPDNAPNSVAVPGVSTGNHVSPLQGNSNLLPIDLEGTVEAAPSTAPDATSFTISNARFEGRLWFDPNLHQIKTQETTIKLLLQRPDQPVLQFQQTETLTLKSVSYTKH